MRTQGQRKSDNFEDRGRGRSAAGGGIPIQAVAGLVREQVGVEAEVVLVPPHALPQNSSGKLSRSRAKALYLDGTFGAPGPAAQPAAAAS